MCRSRFPWCASPRQWMSCSRTATPAAPKHRPMRRRSTIRRAARTSRKTAPDRPRPEARKTDILLLRRQEPSLLVELDPRVRGDESVAATPLGSLDLGFLEFDVLARDRVVL